MTVVFSFTIEMAVESLLQTEMPANIGTFTYYVETGLFQFRSKLILSIFNDLHPHDSSHIFFGKNIPRVKSLLPFLLSQRILQENQG
jgi:hypothetical protein